MIRASHAPRVALADEARGASRSSRAFRIAVALLAGAIGAALLSQVGAAHAAAAGSGASPGQGPGWTGITKPKDVITAREELMEHIELLMEPIDTIQVEPVRDVNQLHLNAETISAMLLAVPHLFPPTTNLYDPKAQIPATLALPAIWKSFGTFYQLAGAASSAADAMASATGTSALRAASLRLRASCDACHTLFLRHYSPPKVLESDYQFDFDSVLGKKK